AGLPTIPPGRFCGSQSPRRGEREGGETVTPLRQRASRALPGCHDHSEDGLSPMHTQTTTPLPWEQRVIRFYADLSRASSPTALLRFAPLTEPPPAGFSWLRTALDPATGAIEGPRVDSAHQALRRRMLDTVRPADVRRAVDLGCGNGADVVWLATEFPSAQV